MCDGLTENGQKEEENKWRVRKSERETEDEEKGKS